MLLAGCRGGNGRGGLHAASARRAERAGWCSGGYLLPPPSLPSSLSLSRPRHLTEPTCRKKHDDRGGLGSLTSAHRLLCCCPTSRYIRGHQMCFEFQPVGTSPSVLSSSFSVEEGHAGWARDISQLPSRFSQRDIFFFFFFKNQETSDEDSCSGQSCAT